MLRWYRFLASNLHGPLRYIAAGFEDWRERFHDRLGWDRLGERLQAEFLHERGQDAADNSVLYTGSQASAGQLSRMIDVFGIGGSLDRVGYRGVRQDMQRVCVQCNRKRLCNKLLARGITPQDCDFCPNRYTLEVLRREFG